MLVRRIPITNRRAIQVQISKGRLQAWRFSGRYLATASTSALKTSHVKGPSDVPLYEKTTGQFIKELALKYGDLPAVISTHQNVRISYKRLDELATILANNLRTKSGVRKGDRVAVCAGNLWQYPVIQLGLAKLGAILVPLNPAFTDSQFHSALNSSQSRALIIQSHLSRGSKRPPRDISGLALAATEGNILPNLKEVFLLPSANSYTGGGDHTELRINVDGEVVNWFEKLLEENETSIKPYENGKGVADDIINMQFTSGTTSTPKISCLTHRNLLNNGILIGQRMGLSATNSHHPSGQDRLCIPVPMFHCFGLVLSNLALLSSGAALVFPSESFDAPAAIEAVRSEQCSGIHGVPTMFSAELDYINETGKEGLQYLRKGIAAGSSIPIEMMRVLNNVLSLTNLVICYGMTETAPVSFMTVPDDALEKRVNTVGTVMPHTEAKIVIPVDESSSKDIHEAAANDPESDIFKPLPTGQRGEIIISGYLVHKGYHNEPEKTAASLVKDSDGKVWMRTGDEGMIDEDGYLTVTGRIKDLIIRGGENIHPLEIENTLFTHPAVSQVSVVGVPDEKYGEAVAAFISFHDHVLSNKARDRPSEDDIRQFVKDRLGHYMVPKYVFYVPDFPKTASGKIRKVDLKETAKSLIGIAR